MEQYGLKKIELNKLMSSIMNEYDIVAPVEANKQKQHARSLFKKISDPEEISLKKKTYFPVKGFFFRSEETLFEFDGNKIVDPKVELKETVFFGLRKCDLNGIMHQDMVFLDKNTDPFYKARRDASTLIGYHCKEGDEYCFCESFELKDFFDLMFYEKEEEYIVEIGSEKGRVIIDKYSSYFNKKEDILTEEDRKIKNKKRLDSQEIKDMYNDKDWERGSDKCIACGACNFLCPNCHCFSIRDDVNLDLKTGKRVRVPASCQLKHFTRVAGDHIFRESKVSRFKHRIYHQIQYFKERHGLTFCTGCGRCIEGCPAKIDWVEIINQMKSQTKIDEMKR
jgi:sulfhydrogenase subunit beta (sulfur reductase)